jgi:hypothetical protein
MVSGVSKMKPSRTLIISFFLMAPVLIGSADAIRRMMKGNRRDR